MQKNSHSDTGAMSDVPLKLLYSGIRHKGRTPREFKGMSKSVVLKALLDEDMWEDKNLQQGHLEVQQEFNRGGPMHFYALGTLAQFTMKRVL